LSGRRLRPRVLLHPASVRSVLGREHSSGRTSDHPRGLGCPSLGNASVHGCNEDIRSDDHLNVKPRRARKLNDHVRTAARLTALERRLKLVRGRPSDTETRVALLADLDKLLASIAPKARGGRRWLALLRRARMMRNLLVHPRLATQVRRRRKAARDREKTTSLICPGPKALRYRRIDAGDRLYPSGQARTTGAGLSYESVRTVSGGLPSLGSSRR